MKILLKFATIVLFLGCACTTKKYEFPQEPEPVIVVQPGGDKCQSACDTMANLGCEEGTPICLEDGGVITCTDMCIYDHINGIYWNTECLTEIEECDEIEDLCNQ